MKLLALRAVAEMSSTVTESIRRRRASDSTNLDATLLIGLWLARVEIFQILADPGILWDAWDARPASAI